jgi:hypothetical protein
MSSQYRANADAIDEERESSQDHRVSFDRRVLPTMLRYREPESSKSNTGCSTKQAGKALWPQDVPNDCEQANNNTANKKSDNEFTHRVPISFS